MVQLPNKTGGSTAMENQTNEILAAAYTIYSLLNPSDKVTVSTDSFANSFDLNLKAFAALERPNQSNVPLQRQAPVFDEEKAAAVLKKGFGEAEKTIDNTETLGQLLNRVKEKMKSLPMVGTVLSNVPTMFKLVSSYYKGEYSNISRGNLIFIISALSYLISPIDLIPDLIPVVGLLDDMAVISLCVKQTGPALAEYLAWREKEPAIETTEEE